MGLKDIYEHTRSQVLLMDPLLVITPLAVKIALGAKLKLGFINGSYKISIRDSPLYDQWTRVICMITSWILNSIFKEIVEAFLYSSTARELWCELEERYGESNSPILYQLQRETSSITQGRLMSVIQYYNKLKTLWDELTYLMPMPECVCGSEKAVAEITSFNRLMQFLMALKDIYEHTRSQVLLMDPLLVTTPLAVEIALGAKLKLGFINGSYKISSRDSLFYDQ
ncbi:uncharacterized protein LOC107262073 [Ricinus communis]|uniref:uncharacterized protein LOC107262073 n=1 Tax=Ricinus communis TaxID=3988 RepID=UPI000772AF6C|nr:uncharacterized protein LOC107262073 [Ricinus communis]|eukprot:XP_015581046.1 uncharacterized protein LOC107262073 [Ricinus communis]